MSNEFLEKYTAALNRATEISEKLRKMQILVEGVDDHLIRELEKANTEVDRLSNQLIEMYKQQ